jgi:hypothetical protein
MFFMARYVVRAAGGVDRMLGNGRSLNEHRSEARPLHHEAAAAVDIRPTRTAQKSPEEVSLRQIAEPDGEMSSFGVVLISVL